MKRVLIVDDAIELGRMLKDALKTVYPAIPVSVVPSAEEAMLEASRYTVDLLVTDIRLPGISGLELIRKIRLRQPEIRVIVMTGLAEDDQLKRRTDEARPDIFLRKPVTASLFLDSVAKLIGDAAGVAQTAEPGAAPAAAAKPTAADTTADDLLRELAGALPGKPVTTRGKTHPLRKGTGMLRGEEAAEPQPEQQGLSGVISRVRATLAAVAVTLLDERGRPVAQAGEIPVEISDPQLIPAVIAALSAGARVGLLLGQTFAHAVQAYRGVEFDLLAAPVGQYTVIIALRGGRSALRLAIATEEALSAQTELAEALAAMGLRVSTTQELGAPEAMLEEEPDEETAEEVVPPELLETPLGQDPGLEKFESLFIRKQTGQLAMQDPDAFWDEVAGGERGEVDQTGVLTFDQAQKLGLLPEDKQD